MMWEWESDIDDELAANESLSAEMKLQVEKQKEKLRLQKEAL